MRFNHLLSEGSDAKTPLLAGGAAALLASTCCLGPLVLVSFGLGGAWVSNLTALEPYRPTFITAALLALLLAWRRIERPQAACKPGEVCARPRVRTGYRVGFWSVALLVGVAIAYPAIVPFFY